MSGLGFRRSSARRLTLPALKGHSQYLLLVLASRRFTLEKDLCRSTQLRQYRPSSRIASVLYRSSRSMRFKHDLPPTKRYCVNQAEYSNAAPNESAI